VVLRKVILDPDIVDGSVRPGAIVVSILTACTVIRVLGFGFDWTRWSVVHPVYLYGSVIDLTYLSIAPAHIVWPLYVAKTFDNEYRHFDEPPLQRALSYFVLINMACSLIVSYFFPEYWVAAIAWGGLVLGAKMYFIGSLPVSEAGRREFRKGGRLTAMNTLSLMIVGFVFAGDAQSLVHKGQWNWTRLSWLISGIVTYAGLELIRRHVTRRASRQYVGLLGR
jgi:hypothetical protein